jgi:hypothetical protein
MAIEPCDYGFDIREFNEHRYRQDVVYPNGRSLQVKQFVLLEFLDHYLGAERQDTASFIIKFRR